MSLEFEASAARIARFWTNIQRAIRLVPVGTFVDSPRLDVGRYEEILRDSDLWLTPKAVEGFDAEAFCFLSDDEQQELTRCVAKFEEVAREVSPSHAATEEQFRRARGYFQRILEVLRPDKFADAESLVIGKEVVSLLSGRLPEWVAYLLFESDEDSTGRPSLWVWVVVDDVAAKEDVLYGNVRLVENMLDECLRDLGVDRRAYVELRTVSEQESELNR